MLRITGGEYRSRILKLPKGAKMRPTMDKVRQAVFNMIAELVPESSFLDLFSGTGAFGIEALSRGAKRAVFVESDNRCRETIAENLFGLQIPDSFFGIISAPAERAIESLAAARERFDIVFLDPPYYTDLARKSLIKLASYDIVTRVNRIIIEHHKKDILAEVDGILLLDRRAYGDIVISMYERRAAHGQDDE